MSSQMMVPRAVPAPAHWGEPVRYLTRSPGRIKAGQPTQISAEQN